MQYTIACNIAEQHQKAGDLILVGIYVSNTTTKYYTRKKHVLNSHG